MVLLSHLNTFTVGGHIDAWDVGEGAVDDGGGCIQAIEMIRIYKKAWHKTKTNSPGGNVHKRRDDRFRRKDLRSEAKRKGEIHYAALESDRGVMSPLGIWIRY